MSNKIKVAINGFGRIGRNLYRLLLDHDQIEVVAINDIASAHTLSHLLKYDSIHGKLKNRVSFEEDFLFVDDKKTPILSFSHPQEINWDQFGVDVVVEASGKFKSSKDLEGHLSPGVKKVILAVPPNDDSIKMVVLGVNESILDGSEKIISNASCTTNNAAPMLEVIHRNFGVKQAYITTVHSYTSDQSLHDRPHRDLRRSRAAAQSIIPTTTGAAKALTKIFPDLSEVIGGCGIRVPVPNGSLTDMTLNVQKPTSIEEVNKAFKTASETYLKGLLSYTTVPLVSIDINGEPFSCIFDSQMTSVIGGDLIKLIGWYDNEIGYSSRLIDLISFISKN
ncbi:type I glyceraldehyde-3-phosphate dehydrogenase [Antarcticibacterium flavum]|uniref:Type I glyceraldehyde-3-phosphate dehydrogenase n=1 Tax=Antarcticibacterium flavum TaxID=2058175 RepID=A0A5B7X4M2_9FLAO|nr:MULTISPECIES: type I glyceraldehyde-3-phosphate dehydrogenase [Antarcticibacterium]MCM4160016.1 type I glyceraldehyde-3-phosphate dehydrogenase [Antarcticibacterium sp. W02-3]QCY70396.1 type I glyceraldehyde-3-phosphate dehydrogenase [Antarcticibacterium flavum]